jgi:hypothetical protein
MAPETIKERIVFMRIIQVTHEQESPSPHVTFIDASPASAAATIEQRFGQEVEAVYQKGRFVYVPIDVQPEQFWQALDNGV